MFDLVRRNYDYVDNPFWSVIQVKVNLLDSDIQRQIGEYDKGNVLPLIIYSYHFCFLSCIN